MLTSDPPTSLPLDQIQVTKHVCLRGGLGGPRFLPRVQATGPGAQGCACEGMCPHVRKCI